MWQVEAAWFCLSWTIIVRTHTDSGHGDPPPDGDGDGGVAHRDDHSRHDEDGEGDQAHVDLPLPRLREVYPALGAVIWPG